MHIHTPCVYDARMTLKNEIGTQRTARSTSHECQCRKHTSEEMDYCTRSTDFVSIWSWGEKTVRHLGLSVDFAMVMITIVSNELTVSNFRPGGYDR